MFVLTAPARPVTFRRHVVAILSANFVLATVFALCVAVLGAFHAGSAAMGMALAMVIWLGTIAVAAPVSGFVYTIAWPFLRKAKGFGWLISTLLGAEGGSAAVWANYGAVGKSVASSELAFAAVFGAALGAAYWFAASGARIKIKAGQANDARPEDPAVTSGS